MTIFRRLLSLFRSSPPPPPVASLPARRRDRMVYRVLAAFGGRDATTPPVFEVVAHKTRQIRRGDM